jgi:hypothetical protein
MAIFLPDDFMPRKPSTIPTTLIGPPQNQNIEAHHDRIPRIIDAMASPFLSPAGAGAWVKAGGTEENWSDIIAPLDLGNFDLIYLNISYQVNFY